MRITRLIFPLLFPVLWGAVPACVIDTVPMPEETSEGDEVDDGNVGGVNEPGADFSGVSSSAIYYSDEPTWIVGAEGAVPGEGMVIIQPVGRFGARVEVPSNFEGAFSALIDADPGDTISIAYEIEGILSAHTTMLLEMPSVAAFGASGDLDAAPTPEDSEAGAGEAPTLSVSAPGAGGLITVSGAAGLVSPGIVVVIANVDNGDATTAAVQSDGSFSAQLLGSSGNEIVLFGVEPATNHGGGGPVTLVVP